MIQPTPTYFTHPDEESIEQNKAEKDRIERDVQRRAEILAHKITATEIQKFKDDNEWNVNSHKQKTSTLETTVKISDIN